MKAKIIGCLAAGFFAGPMAAQAVTIDFDSGVPAGVSLGGDMLWDSRGGGHLYMESYNTDDFISFAAPTTVNSFQMNSNPWSGYGYPSSGPGWLVDIEAFDAALNSLWSTTVDLSSYLSWDTWLTVDVGVANVSRLVFYSPLSHGKGYWPSIDNLVVNEAAAAVAAPGTLALLGLGLAGLGLLRRLR